MFSVVYHNYKKSFKATIFYQHEEELNFKLARMCPESVSKESYLSRIKCKKHIQNLVKSTKVHIVFSLLSIEIYILSCNTASLSVKHNIYYP